MRRRVLLDVDGVLADFSAGSRPEIERILGRKAVDEDFLRWDVTWCLKDDLQREEFGRAVDSPGFCAGLPVIPGSRDGVDSLRLDGHEVVFVTSHRMTSKTWVHERDRWLMEHFAADQRDIVHCHRKEFVRGNVLVDDRPKNVEVWGLHHPDGAAILWDQPYNRYAELEHPGIRRTASWDDVRSAMGAR